MKVYVGVCQSEKEVLDIQVEMWQNMDEVPMGYCVRGASGDLQVDDREIQKRLTEEVR